jgi:hypothetical protein
MLNVSNFLVDGCRLGPCFKLPGQPGNLQSPCRWSGNIVDGKNVGPRNGEFRNTIIDQTGSTNDIAANAIHSATAVNFHDCIIYKGEWSLDSAGSGVGNIVSGCSFSDIKIYNSKLALNKDSPQGNHFTRITVVNLTGEGISVNCTGKGNTFDQCDVTSPLHGIHFYTPGDTVFTNTTLHAPTANVPLMTGWFTVANNGSGNKVVTAP